MRPAFGAMVLRYQRHRRVLPRLAIGAALGLACASGHAADELATPAPAANPRTPAASLVGAPATVTRNGRDIYARFRAGLADPVCDAETSRHWQQHFANAPRQLASRNSDALALFGYVVDALREASLPTEYALIPFVESGYRPGARSGAGPAGLWQFIALTARNHQVSIRPGYDGRLSPVESTQAAVRYLKTLHGMFAGDWRLAVMAFNAGEYRVFGALQRSGQKAADARPDQLVGLSAITQGYVRKLHALSCVLDRADDDGQWMQSIDRPVAALVPSRLPAGAASLDAWAATRGFDPALLKRINPALPEGRIDRNDRDLRVLAPLGNDAQGAPIAAAGPEASDGERVTTLADADQGDDAPPEPEAGSSSPAPRTHTVVRGDSIWRVAQRYGLSRSDLIARNQLNARSVLRPGMLLKIDADTP